jgi:hypothetical protein
MKYLDEYRDGRVAAKLVDELRRVQTQPWVIMEVCGGQTHSIVKNGIDYLLPRGVELVHGPGCPVPYGKGPPRHRPRLSLSSTRPIAFPATCGLRARASQSLFTIFEVLEVIKVAICTWEAEAIAMGDEAEKAVSQRREPGAV